jgi:elongation factor Ts
MSMAGGKIGVLVNLEVSDGIDATEIGRDVAMQIAALNPRFWDKSQVTQDILDEEKKILVAQMANDPKMASKPEEVKNKIASGKLNKFYEENCLLQQEFVKDSSMTVEQYIASAAKTLGGKVTFKDAVRFEKGEGIEKKKENFAEEIASMVK